MHRDPRRTNSGSGGPREAAVGCSGVAVPLIAALAFALASVGVMAAPKPPTELAATVRVDDQTGVFWEPEDDARTYNLYKGRVRPDSGWVYNHVCLAIEMPDTTYVDPARPAVGELF